VNTRFERATAFQQESAEFFTDRIRKSDVSDYAASKKAVGEGLFGAVKKLVGKDNVARLVFCLKRADGADADNPGDVEFFHRPDIAPMIQLAREDEMASSMARQEHDLAPRQFARQQL